MHIESRDWSVPDPSRRVECAAGLSLVVYCQIRLEGSGSEIEAVQVMLGEGGEFGALLSSNLFCHRVHVHVSEHTAGGDGGHGGFGATLSE